MQHTTGKCRAGVLRNIFTISFVVNCLLLAVNRVNAGDIRTQSLIELHEDNWQMMLKGEWMVEFFAPWCPACKSLAPTWERFASSAITLGVNVAKIDVTTSPSLSGRFFVTALPTIYHVKDGEFRQYRGSRDGDALMQYIKLKQWEKTEPLSIWKKPNTVHMSILSYFFKLSHTLKDFNGRLQEEYGLPTWGSYALFAIGTIFVGAALGLILVCVVDFVLPPNKGARKSFSETKAKSLDGVEDIANDEIEDDVEKIDECDDDDDASGSEADEVSQDDEEEQKLNNEDDDEDNDNDNKTSGDEKYSHSETEAAGNILNRLEKSNELLNNLEEAAAVVEEATGATASTTAEVRKRKPRKAD